MIVVIVAMLCVTVCYLMTIKPSALAAADEDILALLKQYNERIATLEEQLKSKE